MKKGFRFYASLAFVVWSTIAIAAGVTLAVSRTWDAGQYTILAFMVVAYAFLGWTVLQNNVLKKRVS